MKKSIIFAISLALVVCIPVHATTQILPTAILSLGQQNATASHDHHDQSLQTTSISLLQDNSGKDDNGEIDKQPKTSNINMTPQEKQNSKINQNLHSQTSKTTNHSFTPDKKEKDTNDEVEEQPKTSHLNMTGKENGQQNATITYRTNLVQLLQGTTPSSIGDENPKVNNRRGEEQSKTRNFKVIGEKKDTKIATTNQDQHYQLPQKTNTATIVDEEQKENNGKVEQQPKAIFNRTGGEKGPKNATTNQDQHDQLPQKTNSSSIMDEEEKENNGKVEKQHKPTVNRTGGEKGQKNATTTQDRHDQFPQKNNTSSIADEEQKENNGEVKKQPKANANMTGGEKGQINATANQDQHDQLPQQTNSSSIVDEEEKENNGKVEKQHKPTVNRTGGEKGQKNATTNQVQHGQLHQKTNTSSIADEEEKENNGKVEKQHKPTVNRTGGEKGQKNATTTQDRHDQFAKKTNASSIADEEQKENNGKVEKEPDANVNMTTTQDRHDQFPQKTNTSSIADEDQKENNGKVKKQPKANVNMTGGEKGSQNTTTNQDHHSQLPQNQDRQIQLHHISNEGLLNMTINSEKSETNGTSYLDHHGQLSKISNTSLIQDNRKIDTIVKVEKQPKESNKIINSGNLNSINGEKVQQNETSNQDRKNQLSTTNTSMIQEGKQSDNDGKVDDQNKDSREDSITIFRQIWNQMSPDSRKKCVEQFLADEKNDAEYLKMTQAEREAEWNKKTEDEKACVFHMYEERRREASEKLDGRKNDENKNDARSSITTHSSSELKKEHKLIINKEEESDKTKNTSSENMKKDVYGVVSKEEANRLRHLWITLDVDFQKKCYEMYKENEHPIKSETDEWNNIDRNERKEEIIEIWQTLPDNMKACSIHIRDEDAKLEDIDRKKNTGNKKKSVYSLVTEEDAKRLRQVWFTLDLYHYQKILKEYKKCYEMYTYDEHPTKKEAKHWKNLSQEKRREEILQIWPTLPDNIKACALHIADEEAKFSKKESIKKQEKKATCEQKKVVHGGVTEVEANRLRHLWIDLSFEKKRQCYELYKKNEHPSKADARIWKSMSPKERREEIFKEWYDLSDSLKACAIHIADYEAKLEKEKNNKTPEPKEITTNDQRINNKKGIKDTVNSHLQNKDEGKSLNSKPHNQIQNSNKNEDSPSQKPNNSNQPLDQSVHNSPISQGNQMKNNGPTKKEEEASLRNVWQLGQR